MAIKGTLDFINCVKRLEDFKKIFPRGKTALAGQFPQPPKTNLQISSPRNLKKEGDRGWKSNRSAGLGAQSSQAAPQLMFLERVHDSWKNDAFFGYQFLNGANPMLLRRSSSLPARLVLPPGMEDLKTQLEKELQVLPLSPPPFSLPPSPPSSALQASQLWHY